VSPRLPDNLKILHVLDHSVPLHSGYSFRTLALLREQNRRGWQTAHLTSPKHTQLGPEVEEVDGFRFHRTRQASGIGSNSPPFAEIRLVHALARKIIKVAEAEQPHILHAHSPALNALACLLANRKLGLPVVYEVRAFWEDAAVSNGTITQSSLRYRLTRSLETFVLRNSDAVTTICDGLRQDMLERGLCHDKVAIVPNGVDLERFPFLDRTRPSEKARAIKQSLGLEGKIVLGFLGSFYPYEGLSGLLEALPMVLQQRPEVRLLLVGGGPDETNLKALAQSLGLGEAVRFVGRVANKDILAYYEVTDVFVFPRLSERLTQIVTPLKPLEAMATGGITVASDVGGHRELIDAGETGYLFQEQDAAGLARSLLNVLRDSDEWPIMRANARRYVEEKRTWPTCTSVYETVYRNVMNGCAKVSSS